jgi:hypothetical protein
MIPLEPGRPRPDRIKKGLALAFREGLMLVFASYL